MSFPSQKTLSTGTLVFLNSAFSYLLNPDKKSPSVFRTTMLRTAQRHKENGETSGQNRSNRIILPPELLELQLELLEPEL